MLLKMGKRMFTETDLRLLGKFIYNLGIKAMGSLAKHKKRLKKGRFYPPFLFISLTDSCNLKCRGCWVSENKNRSLPYQTLDNIISGGKKMGNYFYGLLGGEPLLYPGLLTLIEKHKDCYFQVFTNGTLLTKEIAEEMFRLGNVSPLISLEGLEKVSDVRRGGKNVYESTMKGIQNCVDKKLITGVASSICQSNFKELVSEKYIYDLIDLGVHYAWYSIYRPVGENPCPELALSQNRILELREFIVDIRTRAPIAILEPYWDGDGKALCPGAAGVSHHINPAGDVEFCPPIQFAVENTGDGKNLGELFDSSAFLREFREFAAGKTDGCILLEDPGSVEIFLNGHKAIDSSGRSSAYRELNMMKARPCHHIPGKEIPEKHWAYRLAKKNWLFGFGAYG